MNKPNQRSFKIATSIVMLSALFYLYEFFIRVTPGALANQLMADLNLNAVSLSFLSATFFYAYAPMQIPAGLLCDRFGPSKALTWATAICALASLAFAFSHNIYISVTARFFIGLAAAFAFIGPLALAKRWLAPAYFAMATGFIQLLGCLGAIIGTRPIAKMADLFGWRPTMVVAAILGIVLALMYKKWLFDHPPQTKAQTSSQPLSPLTCLKQVLSTPQIGLIALAGFASWAPISVFAELWGANFLITEYQATTAQATEAIIWIWLGIAIGSPLAGAWSNRIRSRKIPLAACYTIGVTASLLLIGHHAHNNIVLSLLLFCMGLSTSAQVLAFAVGDDIIPKQISSTAVGLINMAVIAGGVVLQPLVGYILETHWDHTIINHVPIYDLHAYHLAMLILPAASALGLIALFFLKETHPNNRKNNDKRADN